MLVPKNEIEKNKNVSIIEPRTDEVIGATNQALFLSRWKISMSTNCATRKAVPDPIAILIEITSSKFVETKRVNKIPTVKPKYTNFLAFFFPNLLLNGGQFYLT